jgi:deoxyribonuclease V
VGWPNADELAAEQRRLAEATWTPWRPVGHYRVGACFACFEQREPGPGLIGDRGWAAAAVEDLVAVSEGVAPAPYVAGQLALREGPLLEEAVRALPVLPDVLIVVATGRDHPRRCGLALQLGAVLAVATVGVTHRPLRAHGEWPEEQRGSATALVLRGEHVGYWLRTRPGARPLAVHAAWRTGPETAVEVVLGVTGRSRTLEPLRIARAAARRARSGAAVS